MANGNGHAPDGMALPRQMVAFRIGGEDIQVPSLTFWDMDEVKDTLRAMAPDLFWVDYAGNVLKIVAHQLVGSRPELTFDELKRRCSGGEASQLAAQMNELLWASGFPRPPENPAASPGTGTSTGSVPASPAEASVVGTPAL